MATRITHPGLIDLREVRTLNNDGSYTYYPNVDYMYGPYAATTEKSAKEVAFEALSATTDNIKANALVKGKTVGIIEDGNIVEYWFGSDPADTTVGYQVTDLVKKTKEQEPNVTIVDLKQCAVSGGEIPLYDGDNLYVYVYDNMLITNVRTIEEQYAKYIVFNICNLDGAEYEGDFLYFEAPDKGGYVANFVALYTYDEAPYWIKSLFGTYVVGSQQSCSYPGLLSYEDWRVLLDLINEYNTNHSLTGDSNVKAIVSNMILDEDWEELDDLTNPIYDHTPQTKPIVTDFEPSEEEDESESDN